MFKKTIIHLLIGLGVFIFGALVNDFGKPESGQLIMLIGVGYAIISLVRNLLSAKHIVFLEVKKVINRRERNKAQEEILQFKRLLDEGILTPAEFNKKVEELKSKIL